MSIKKLAYVAAISTLATSASAQVFVDCTILANADNPVCSSAGTIDPNAAGLAQLGSEVVIGIAVAGIAGVLASTKSTTSTD